jgi:hypothetical protein
VTHDDWRSIDVADDLVAGVDDLLDVERSAAVRSMRLFSSTMHGFGSARRNLASQAKA